MRNIPKAFTDLKAKWPSAIVARTKVEEFSGGLLKSRSMANADSKGEGPEGRIKMGNLVAYPVDSLIEWMESRIR